MSIKKEQITELLTIIPDNYPSIEIFHLCDRYVSTIKVFNEFSTKREYGYDLFLLDEDKSNFLDSCSFKILKLSQRRYNRHSKLYDFIFIDIDFEKIEDIEQFVKKIYPICKNGAKVIFFCNDKIELTELSKILEENFFVAINSIDNTIDDIEILSAQKMHGWGG